jgi:hypothetical protein
MHAASALALSYRMMTDGAHLQQAQGPALFEVVHVDAVQPGDTETRYLLRCERGVAGSTAFAYEWLALPGAESASHQHFINGIPLLRSGEQWLLFFARRNDGVLQPVQLTLGMFRLPLGRRWRIATALSDVRRAYPMRCRYGCSKPLRKTQSPLQTLPPAAAGPATRRVIGPVTPLKPSTAMR